MRPRPTPWSVPALALLLVALVCCAGPTELARRSHVALEGGDALKAYQLARKALEKEPRNANARESMIEAARAVGSDYRARIGNLAAVDTLGAAKLVLEFAAFRDELRGYRVALDPDPAWDRTESQLRAGAARGLERAGVEAMEARRARVAYARFQEAATFVAPSPELERRTQRAWQLAQTRVVVLPVRDENAGPTLARELTDRLYDDLASRVKGSGWKFTRLVPEADVWNVVTVSQLDGMDRDEAMKIARKLGAQRVVWARTYGLTTDTRSEHFRGPIWHRTEVRDSTGRRVDDWVEMPFESMKREREVNVHWDVQVLSVDDEVLLARDRDTRQGVARTVWTSFLPQDDADRYVLFPPNWKDLHRDRCTEIQKRWDDNSEGFTLAEFLDRAKRQHGRREYKSDYRGEFTGGKPVFLNDLPPAGDMAFVVLAELWRPVYSALKRLDALDDVDVPAVDPAK